MAHWEKATMNGTSPGSRVAVSGAGTDSVRILSPKFRLNDGSDYAIVGFGALVNASTVAAIAVPLNTAVPTINSVQARNPVVGTPFTAADYTQGDWTNSPTGYGYTLKVGGVAKTIPYTFVTGDIGSTVLIEEVATNAIGPGTVKPSAATQAVRVAPPAGSQYLTQITDITTPRYDDENKFIRYLGKNWSWDADYNSWQLATTDNIWIRFETRPGDTMDSPHPYPDSSGTERNRLVEQGTTWHGPTDDFIWKGSFIVDQGFTTGLFKTFIETHTFGTGAGSPNAKKLEFLITTDSKLAINTNYSPTSGNSVERRAWTDTVNFVLGHEYFYEIYYKSNPAGSGRIHIKLDGVVVVNFSGQTGHHLETSYAQEFGTYRGGSPSDIAVIRHKFTEMTFGAYSTLTDPGAPVETLGPELAGSRQPFTSATGVTANNTTCVWDTPTVGYLNITNSIISGNTNGRISVTTEIGAQYKVVMVGKNVTSNNIRVAIFGSAVEGESLNTTATTDTTHTIYFTADSTSTGVFMHNESSTASKVAAIKSISVKKVL